jgi:CDP-glucose 4,6-dehydratase
MLRDVHGARVLVTGHTGFKGSWLAEWLMGHGAQVYGFALEPAWGDSLFATQRHAERLYHTVGDICDADAVRAVVQRAQPEWVFHLAAQPLVRRSYREPVLTWETNVMGTWHLLEALRTVQAPRGVVIVTTDKVYRNTESPVGYRETDNLGGHDPYASSKAACELAVASWRASYGASSGVRVATARAGNVLGGGDWSEDRIVPDCYRAWGRGETVRLRHPGATRPWQHVLEPLSGYLRLAQAVATEADAPMAVNFGPDADALISVGDLVARLAQTSGTAGWMQDAVPGDAAVHETTYLALDTTLARTRLGWRPRLSVDRLVEWTAAGYAEPAGASHGYVERQIAAYESMGQVS